MPQFHIANTFFEHELTGDSPSLLHAGLHSSPLFLQLQYLPFLYGSAEDTVLVTHAPPKTFFENLEKQGIAGPRSWHPISGKKPGTPMKIESWGMSRVVESWASSCGLAYAIPSWELVREVNSKAFSYKRCTPLAHSRLLQNEEQLRDWMRSFEGAKVLKTCYGLSGRGHFHISGNDKDPKDAFAFASPEWQHGRPILAEPWVKRLLDFSTQWQIFSKDRIEYLGATICENDNFGRYCATRIGPEHSLFGDYLPHLEQHKRAALPLLTEIASLGFFGNLGIDAMIYGERHLHPIVEINARKTMGWVALEIARRHFPGRSLRISLAKTQSPSTLLPHSLSASIRFPKNLSLHLD